MGPLEDRYFDWLYAKVAPVPSERLPTPSNTYYRLLRHLHVTPFVWQLSGDDNRAADGVALRQEFLSDTKHATDSDWLALECSVLEMLIAFSRTVEYDTNLSSPEWFWRFLENLGLSDICDGVYEMEYRQIDEILYALVWRTYDHLGHGGMFPLRYSDNDQREVELWYQFCEYVEENGID